MTPTEQRTSKSEFCALGQKQAQTPRAARRTCGPVFGLGMALRSLSSVALSSTRVTPVYHRLPIHPARGTFLLGRKGDISTLH
jgi:hypothetical protein